MASPRGLAGLLCFALAAAAASAAQYRVGEQRGWSVTWSSRMRFIIGDQLLFVYPKDTDSVLLVDQAAYNACNTTTYVSKFQGGSTVFTLDRSGPFFFISGNEASCKAEQKLIVVRYSAVYNTTESKEENVHADHDIWKKVPKRERELQSGLEHPLRLERL
uniref:Uncharacterized protein n=1 Tax=Aegilops tauschii TaxID=37682 RepID=M8C7E9_AEGTA